MACWAWLLGRRWALLKTPLLTAVTKPLTIIESAWREENKQAQTRFELRQAQLKIEHEIWSKNYKLAWERGERVFDNHRPS